MQLGEDEPGAEDDGRVHVVAAGVRAVGHGRAVRAVTLRVRDGQRVDVGAQGEHAASAVDRTVPYAVPCPVPFALPRTFTGVDPDVTDEPGPDVEHAGLEARLLQACLECRGGAELLVAELRVHVQVAPERDQLGTQGVGQGAGERCSPGDIGLVLSGHQLVHPLKGRAAGRPTDPRSTKLQPVRGRNLATRRIGFRWDG